MTTDIQLYQFAGNPRVYALWTDQLYVIFNIKSDHIRLGESGKVETLHGLKAVPPDMVVDGNGRHAPNGGLYKASDILARLQRGVKELADPFAWKEYKTDWVVQANLYTSKNTPRNKNHNNRYILLNV